MTEGKLPLDQERLAKLWDAYEMQEKEFELSLKKIGTLEGKVEELNRVNNVLKKVVEDRDKEIRDLELKVVSLEEQNSKFDPQIKELEKLYKEEKERYSKLFAITEELEEELGKAKRESEIKDKWFERNVGMLENLRESIVDRNIQLHEMEETSIQESKAKALESGLESKKITGTEAEGATHSEPAISQEPSDMPGEISEGLQEDKSVTFKKVDLESDLETQEVPPTSTTSKTSTTDIEEDSTLDTATKNETIYGFTKIPDVDPVIAETLYDAGYSSMNKLSTATTEDLARIDGISPTLARKIRTNLFEME